MCDPGRIKKSSYSSTYVVQDCEFYRGGYPLWCKFFAERFFMSLGLYIIGPPWDTFSETFVGTTDVAVGVKKSTGALGSLTGAGINNWGDEVAIGTIGDAGVGILEGAPLFFEPLGFITSI